MVVSVTPIYAALLAVLCIVLCFRVISVRRGEQISLGDGGNPALRARIRVQANFTEYVPLTLLLILLIELQGGSAIILHALGLMLLVGRVSHSVGLSKYPQVMPLRFWGMVLTFASLALGAIVTLWLALF